jgi:hypothetical protein
VPPSPAAVVTIAHRLELAAHPEVERAVRRVREAGQGWAAIASLLGLDALPCHVDDPAQLAFGYCAGSVQPPEIDRPRSCETARRAARPSPTTGQPTARLTASVATRMGVSASAATLPSGKTNRRCGDDKHRLLP